MSRCLVGELLILNFSVVSVLSNSLPAFGFLTVAEDDQHGFFGGYLVLSQLGRPLEFHCSTPIFPSKAQRILYGSTLRSYVLGELIGQTLVKKAKLGVEVVLTDLEEMLSLGLVWEGSLAWISQTPGELGQDFQATRGLDSPLLELGGYRLTGSTTCQWSAEAMQGKLQPLLPHIDLVEPFDRIREAIEEAQRVTQSSVAEGEQHDAAA